MLTLYASGTWGDVPSPRPGYSVVTWDNGISIQVANEVVDQFELEVPSTNHETGLSRNFRMAKVSFIASHNAPCNDPDAWVIIPARISKHDAAGRYWEGWEERMVPTTTPEGVAIISANRGYIEGQTPFYIEASTDFSAQKPIILSAHQLVVRDTFPALCKRCGKVRTNRHTIRHSDTICTTEWCATCLTETRKKCKACHNVFYTENTKDRWCSPNCRSVHVRKCAAPGCKHRILTGRLYEESFVCKEHKKALHFCSLEHYHAHMIKEHGWKSCNTCGQAFPPSDLFGCWWSRCDTTSVHCRACLDQAHQHDGIYEPREPLLTAFAQKKGEPTFGWELEFTSIEGELQKMIPDSWGIHPDGSVHSGREALTPPHHTHQLLFVEELRNTIARLEKHTKCRQDTGGHMHVGNFNNKDHATKFFILAVKTENLWFNLCKPERDRSTYCHKTSGVLPVNRIGTELRVRARSRYCAVNFEAYNRHQTVEIRAHHGTTNLGEIILWEQFWGKMWKAALKKYKDRPYNCCLAHLLDHLGLDGSTFIAHVEKIRGITKQFCKKPRRISIRSLAGMSIKNWWDGTNLAIPAPVVITPSGTEITPAYNHWLQRQRETRPTITFETGLGYFRDHNYQRTLTPEQTVGRLIHIAEAEIQEEHHLFPEIGAGTLRQTFVEARYQEILGEFRSFFNREPREGE